MKYLNITKEFSVHHETFCLYPPLPHSLSIDLQCLQLQCSLHDKPLHRVQCSPHSLKQQMPQGIINQIVHSPPLVQCFTRCSQQCLLLQYNVLVAIQCNTFSSDTLHCCSPVYCTSLYVHRIAGQDFRVYSITITIVNSAMSCIVLSCNRLDPTAR